MNPSDYHVFKGGRDFVVARDVAEAERVLDEYGCIDEDDEVHMIADTEQFTIATVEQYVYQGDRSKTLNAFRVSRLVGSLETLFRLEGLRVTGFTRGEGLAAIGVPNNAAEATAKKAIERWTKAMGGEFPSNEHSRAAYAQAWRAQSVALRVRP